MFDRTVWIHDVSDVWMNGWVLKKLSKDVFDGFADDVKDIKQELQHMYVCVPHVRKIPVWDSLPRNFFLCRIQKYMNKTYELVCTHDKHMNLCVHTTNI